MDKRWFNSYQQGVPHEINLDAYANLVDLINESCLQHADRVAYENMKSTLLFSELDELSRPLAIYLQQLGLKKGDRVAIMMPNMLQYPVTLFAILRAGFVVVNTNPLYTADELAYQINDSGARVIVVMENFANTIVQALPHMPLLKHMIVTQLGDLFSPIKRLVVNAVIRYIKKMVPAYHLPQAISYNDALKKGLTGELAPVSLTQEDLAFIQYTGGTTGISKGAKLSHKNMLANLLQASAWISPLGVNSEDIVITALPLYHIFSLTANCLTFLKAGAKNILITNPRDMKQFIHEIKHARFTAITGVNTLFNALLNHPNFSDIDFSKLKLALSGGMALQKSVSIRWHEKTHAPILEAYGLTETSPAVTINPMYLTQYNGSIGLPLPSTDISIRDLDGHEVALGEKGELCVTRDVVSNLDNV